jgi:hypothetical protein
MTPMSFPAKIRNVEGEILPPAGASPGSMVESGTPAMGTGGRFSYGIPNPEYLSGGAHPELSGRIAQPGGVLRRPMQFGESSEPSPLLDLRHPEATAPDVWHTIRNIDANTRFNPDPEVEGLNEVRRSIRGGLRGNLVEAAPQIAEPSQTYSDLMSAQDALDRTMHSGTSINKLLSIPATPIESTVGAGLYNTGQVLKRIGESKFTPLLPVPPQQQGAQ